MSIVTMNSEQDDRWLSLSDLAHLKGVDKSSVSRRVKRLFEQDLLEIRAGDGGQKLVSLAAYERAAAAATDGVRETNGRSRNAGGSGLSREQARRAALQADLAELELAERLGHRLPVEDVKLALDEASHKVVHRLESLPSLSDDLASAAAKGGTEALRRVLFEFAQGATVIACDAFSSVAPKGGRP